MTGTTIAQAIPIAISPILTRLYTPEDFGTLALFVAIVGFLSIAASARYEMALLLPKKQSDAVNIFGLAFVINVVVSFLLLVIVILFYDKLLFFVGSKDIGNWFYLIPLSVFIVALFNQLSAFNNRMKHYKDIARVSVYKAIVLSIVQLGAGVFKLGAIGLISGQIMAQVSANIQLAKNILIHENIGKSISKVKMIALAKCYKDFPRYNLPHALLSTFASNLPIYLFTPFFGSIVVGYYSFALMIVFTPLMILAGATAKVYNQKVVVLYHKSEDAYGFSKKILLSLTVKIVPVFIMILLFAPFLFSIVFGKEWEEAGVYTQILSPFLLLNILVSTIAFIPNLVGAQKKAFRISFIHVVVLCGVLYFFSKEGNVYAALIGLCIVNSCVLLYNLNWMLKSLKSAK
jgi:O-antigen/teichoic acid export membrane protein